MGKSARHRPEQEQMDGLDRLAKVRVAGSNPVVRSKEIAGQRPLLGVFALVKSVTLAPLTTASRPARRFLPQWPGREVTA